MTLPAPDTDGLAFSAALSQRIAAEIDAAGGWIGFARFMELALYAPGMGYYSGGARKFGAAGDFVTAPELSPVFSQTIGAQVAQILPLSAPQIIEVGAGSAGWQRICCLNLNGVRRYPLLTASSTSRANYARDSGKRSPNVRPICLTGCAGSTACPNTSTAWCWPMSCSMPCRSIWLSGATRESANAAQVL